MSRANIIILAAGASSRMGEPKPLAPWRDGTLVERAVDAVREAGMRPIVVLGEIDPSQIRALVGEAAFVINAAWKDGMASSIAAGVAEVPTGAVFGVLAVDQPLVSAANLRALLSELDATRDAACALHDGLPGIPAVFQPHLRDVVGSLDGDKGARAILRSGEYSVAAIEAIDARDADDPDMLRTLARDD